MNCMQRGLAFIALECQPPGDLHDALGLQSGDTGSKRRAGDLAEGGAGQVRIRVGKFRVVENIESFEPQFEGHALGESYVFRQG